MIGPAIGQIASHCNADSDGRKKYSPPQLVVLIVFNAGAPETKDDIGLAQSLTAVPNDVLAALFGAPQSLFDQIPALDHRVVISNRPDGQTGARPSG